MTDKISTHNLVGVPETLMIPLYARAVETRREDAIIRDDYAVQMIARIDYDFTRFEQSVFSNLGVAIRTEILDELTATYIENHPDAVVINIGAGLDTRFFRVDNGRIAWYELDLPESIEIREQFMQPTDRHRFIAASALDFAWMDAVEQGRDTLIIIEGLLMYFDEADVKSLLLALAGRFPDAELLIEVMGRSQAQKTHLNDAVSKTGATFKWGIRHPQAIAEWDARLNYLADISIYDRYEERWLNTGYDWPAPLQDLRNTVDRIVHLKVGT